MAGEASIADAYLSIIPSMSGSQGIITKELTASLTGSGSAAEKAGALAGSSLGASLLTKTKAALAPAAVAGAVVGVGTGLYKLGETFDEVTDTIRVGTGATGDALDGLVAVAKNVGSEVPASWADIGSTVADLNTRLGLSGDELEKVASQYLEAGNILGQKVDIQSTTAAFSAFGIEGKNVEGAMDSLFRVSQATGVGMNDLAKSVQAQAPALQALGFSFEESASLVGSLDKAGINSTATMAAMSKGLVTLAKDGEEPQAAFRRVTDEISKMIESGDKAGAIQLASKIFGTRGATQFIGAVESGKLAVDDLVGSVGATDDTILGVASQTQDFAEKWALVKQNAQLALEPLGSAVFSAVSSALGSMVGPMQAVSSWMQDNPGLTQAVVTGLGVLAVGLGVASAAMWVMNSALLANPITWVIVGIVALGAAIVALATNWSTVTAWITSVGQAFLAWWNGMWSAAGASVSRTWDNITTWVTTKWNAAISSIQGLGPRLTSWWGGLWSSVGATLSAKWNAMIAWVSGVPGRIIGALASLGGRIFSTMSAAGNRARDGISSGFQAAIAFVAGIPSRIAGALGGVGGILFSAGASIINGFLNGLRSAYGRVQSFVSGIAGWIASHKGPESVDRQLLVPAGGWIMGGLEAGLRAGIPSLRDTLDDVTNEIRVGTDVSSSAVAGSQRALKVNSSAAFPSTIVVRVDGRDMRGYVEEISESTTAGMVSPLSSVRVRDALGV